MHASLGTLCISAARIERVPLEKKMKNNKELSLLERRMEIHIKWDLERKASKIRCLSYSPIGLKMPFAFSILHYYKSYHRMDFFCLRNNPVEKNLFRKFDDDSQM